MKKNLMTVLILALLVVNIVLTSVMLVSIVGTNKKTAQLVDNITTAMNLELTVPGDEETTNVALTDTEVYNIADSMTIPLKSEAGAKQDYIMFDVSLSINKKHKDYKTYGSSDTLASYENLIKDAITATVSAHTEDEYISNAGRNADSETDSDNYEKYDSAEALEEALNEKNLESNEELAETVQEALVEDSLADQVSVSFTAQYVQLSMKGALLFDSGSDSLKDQAKAVLDKVGVILERYGSNSTIEIEGHTDNVPIHSARFADNEELSSARALSVFYYLTETTSLDPSDLRHAGMGDRVPVADNSTEEGRSKNRRVEIRIYNPSTTY